MRLAGVRVLVTRAAGDHDEIGELLRREGAVVRSTPSIRIEPDPLGLAQAASSLSRIDWAVFTSPHGVKVWKDARERTQWPIASRIAAVGPATKKASEAAGWKVSFVPTAYTTESLGRELPDVEGRRVLLLRAKKGNPELAVVLTRRGAIVVDVLIYDTLPDGSLPAKMEAIVRDRPAWILFASPSAAEAFDAGLPFDLAAALRVGAKAACMGPVTAEAARRLGYQVAALANPHTIQGLVESVVEAHANA